MAKLKAKLQPRQYTAKTTKTVLMYVELVTVSYSFVD